MATVKKTSKAIKRNTRTNRNEDKQTYLEQQIAAAKRRYNAQEAAVKMNNANARKNARVAGLSTASAREDKLAQKNKRTNANQDKQKYLDQQIATAKKKLAGKKVATDINIANARQAARRAGLTTASAREDMFAQKRRKK